MSRSYCSFSTLWEIILHTLRFPPKDKILFKEEERDIIFRILAAKDPSFRLVRSSHYRFFERKKSKVVKDRVYQLLKISLKELKGMRRIFLSSHEKTREMLSFVCRPLSFKCDEAQSERGDHLLLNG